MLSEQHELDVVTARLIKRDWLCKEEGQRSLLLRLEVPMDEGMINYEPGDHVGVYPINSDEDVDLVMKHLSRLPKSSAMVQLQKYKKALGMSTRYKDVLDNLKWPVFRLGVLLHRATNDSQGHFQVPCELEGRPFEISPALLGTIRKRPGPE